MIAPPPPANHDRRALRAEVYRARAATAANLAAFYRRRALAELVHCATWIERWRDSPFCAERLGTVYGRFRRMIDDAERYEDEADRWRCKARRQSAMRAFGEVLRRHGLGTAVLEAEVTGFEARVRGLGQR